MKPARIQGEGTRAPCLDGRSGKITLQRDVYAGKMGIRGHGE